MNGDGGVVVDVGRWKLSVLVDHLDDEGMFADHLVAMSQGVVAMEALTVLVAVSDFGWRGALCGGRVAIDGGTG
jgi:hypothetical protein